MQTYAMDTSFYTSMGTYDFGTRCEMLAELGFDATYLTLWSEEAWMDVPHLQHVHDRYGLDVAAVYATLNLSPGAGTSGNEEILRLISNLKGCKRVELSIRAVGESIAVSSAVGDGPILQWLEQALAAAEENDVTIALYPHVSFWMERIEDALRLLSVSQHPRLRLVFPAFHWYALDGTRMRDAVTRCAPYLELVNVCGSRKGPASGALPATIEPLDDGEFDIFAFLGEMRRQGYFGPVGVQGYSVGGDVYTKLKRSLATLRDIDRRLQAHPEWSEVRLPRV